MTKHHPHLLAFGYTYLPEEGAEPSYDIVNAHNLAKFQEITHKEHDVTLCDVSHLAEDATTITDVIWRRKDNPEPYNDIMANNSWVFSQMDDIAHP